MKRPIILVMVFCLCITGLCFAGEKLTQEQELVLRIEQVINTRDYIKEQMDKLETQYRNFQIVKIQAERELKVLEAQLDKLENKAKKGKK